VSKKVALSCVVSVAEAETVSVSEKRRNDDKGDDVLKATTAEKTAVIAVVQHARNVSGVDSLLLKEWEDGIERRCTRLPELINFSV
jgi:hypothetical protein